MLPRRPLLAARWAYVAVVALATLTDLHFSGDLTATGQRLLRAFEPSLGWRDAIDGLRNVALFAGLGAVWVLTSPTGQVKREMRRATLVGLALSATVEGAQVFSAVRTASIVDVTTNTVGAFLGAAAIALLIFEAQRARGARSYLGVPAALAAVSYGLAVLCEMMAPLFQSVPTYVEGGPLASLRAMLAHATLAPGAEQIYDAVLFPPAGFLAVMALAERGRSAERSWLPVAAAGATATVVLELAHGLYRLPISWGACALDAAAVVLGTWAAARWLAPLSRTLRGAERARAALLVYVGLLVFWAWRPFFPVTDLHAIAGQLTLEHLIPLQALSGRADVFSAVHVAQQCVLYIPLGALLAVWPLRLAGRWGHLWPALWLALALEAGHVLIDGRFLDVTNALLACAGLAIGWLAVRRAGYQPYGAAWPARAVAAGGPSRQV